MTKFKHAAVLLCCIVIAISLYLLVTPDQVNAATISKVVGSETSVSVNWTAQKKAKKYVVYRKSGDNKFVKIATLSKSVRSYTDKNINMDESYSYRVAGVVRGKKKLGNTRTVTIVEGKEAVKIKSLVRNATSATVYWNKAEYASYYMVFRKVPGGSYCKIGTVSASASSFTDNKLKSNIDYSYTVRAVGKVSDKVYYKGKYDNKGITLISSKPEIKGDFTTLNTTVTWSGVNGDAITGYQVRRKFSTNGSFKTLKTIADPTVTSYKDVYYDSMTADERATYLTAGYFEDPSINSLVYTIRAYRIDDDKISYGNYDYQGVMHTEAPTLTGVKVYKKGKSYYADVSFSLLKNATVYKVYGGYVDSSGSKHWKHLGSFNPKWKYGDCTRTVKTLSKYKYYTVKAGFPMNKTTVFSKYDSGFCIANRKYSNNSVLFMGDSISFGSPYKGKTTVERFSYPWRVGQLTACRYFNPSIPGATYTAKYKDGKLDPNRSRIVVEVADRINEGKTPIYNTSRPISDASGKPVKENVPSYVQYPNTKHFYDFDIIVLEAGTNDWQDNAEIGNIDSTKDTEFYGALNIIMDYITVASQYRVKHGKKPIKLVFTDLYYSDRMTGHFAERNNRFVTKNGKGYTLTDYQIAIDNIVAKYKSYGMEILQMPTLKYCNYDNAPYVMSDNLHMSRYTYGQIGNGMASFLISNGLFSKTKSRADISKLMAYVPIAEVAKETIQEEDETSELISETTNGLLSDETSSSDENDSDAETDSGKDVAAPEDPIE